MLRAAQVYPAEEFAVQRLSAPYLAFFRSCVRWPGLLRVHWVVKVSGGSHDIAACGKSTRVHLWWAVNDARDNAIQSRLVACRGCCALAPEQFANLPRTL